MIVLVGPSGSGKSTLELWVCKQYGLNRVVSLTTRPPRQGEQDGVHYRFVTEEEFSRLDNEGKLAETAEYSGHLYGTLKDDIGDKKVIVVEPNGLEQLVEAVGRDKLIIFYIKVPERERIIRMLRRGDSVNNVIQRVKWDRLHFNYPLVRLLADFTIDNGNHFKFTAAAMGDKLESRGFYRKQCATEDGIW